VSIVTKGITRFQAGLRSGPVNTGLPKSLPWLTNEYIVVGALLRSACLSLNLARVESSTKRGTTSVFTPTFASSLWCETVSDSCWRFHLGAIGPEHQIAADWVLELGIVDGIATIATPSYVTRDGKMEHGDLCSRLREHLLNALALGAPNVGSVEAKASTASLGQVVWPSADAVPAGRSEITAESQLGVHDIAAALSQVGLPVMAWSPGFWRWGLGLQSPTRRNWVTLEATSRQYVTFLRGHLQLDNASPLLHRRIAFAAAHAWIRRAEHLLRQRDPALIFEAPMLFVDGDEDGSLA